MAASPQQIISEGQWDCALFTTYALSLSFFEAHLLRRGLKKNGCREIWVVADAEGYAQSLAERHANNVGQDYRLVPVGLPNGVFHPKCTYLHGEDRDILVIGSGNLTFGGHGNNVEVAEVFDSTRHPDMFGQFADYLRLLGKRSDFENPEPGWIEKFAKLAAEAGRRRTRDPAGPRLLHCLRESVIDQLTASINGEVAAREIRVLSPFYDPDAEAMTQLAGRTKADKITVGLLEGCEDKTTFPFGKARPSRHLEAATVEVEDCNRHLHAKWFEIDLDDGRRLTLTGSVNATRQSLCTINNIEVSVLRTESSESATRLKWKRTKLPKAFMALTRRPAGLGNRLVLHATLSDAGQVEGTMLPGERAKGDWQATLSRSDGEGVTFDVKVAADGRFAAKVPRVQLFDLAGGIQLQLEKAGQAVRGWVQNEALLDLARMRQVPTAEILRFLRDEAEEDDDLVVLEYLTSCIDEVIPAIARRGPGERTTLPEERPSTDAVVPVSALAPRESDTVEFGSELGGAHPDRLGRLLTRLFGHFERDIASPAPAPRMRLAASTQEEGDEPEPAGDDEPETEESAKGRRTQKMLHRFRSFVGQRLEQASDSPQVRALCNAWLLVELQFRLRADENTSEAEAFCRHWLFETARHCKKAESADRLDERVVAAAAVLATNVVHRSPDATELVGIHEALEEYGVSSDADLAGVSYADSFLMRLKIEGSGPLSAGLAAAFGARTRRQEILLVREALTARRPLPDGLAVLQTREGKAISDSVKVGRWPRIVKVEPGRTSCPVDYMGLGEAVCGELERLRLSRCVQCGTFLIQI